MEEHIKRLKKYLSQSRPYDTVNEFEHTVMQRTSTRSLKSERNFLGAISRRISYVKSDMSVKRSYRFCRSFD